jgi:hypothetical protein
MVLLVLVLAVIVFLWARGFLGEQVEKFGAPIEEYCNRIRFYATRDGSNLEILNNGEVDIRHFDIKKFKGGNSEIARFDDFQLDAGESKILHVTFEMENGDDPDKIVIYPALLGNIEGSGAKNSVFTCMDSGASLTI